jgi:rhodanese-related sulfurtransferase
MPVPTLPPADVHARRTAGEPSLLLDVRTPPEFARLHAAGAHPLPLDTLTPAAVAALRPSPTAPVCVICQAGGRAAKACQQLADAGIAPVFNVDGGTTAWERAGLPVFRGRSAVISLERQVRIAAGLLVLAGAVLALAVHPLFVLLSGFVGAGLTFAGLTDTCGMALVLAKMPWNRAGSSPPAACAVRTPAGPVTATSSPR